MRECTWEPWEPWSECKDCTGLRSRSRKFDPARGGGSPCVGDEEESDRCEQLPACAVDTASVETYTAMEKKWMKIASAFE